MREKRSLDVAIVRRYHKVGRKEKTKILNEFVKNTGYNRSYARRLMNKRGMIFVKPGKRLYPMISEVIRILERDGQLNLDEDVRAKLLKLNRYIFT